MVLDQKHTGKPEFLGGDHVSDEFVIALAVAGWAAAGAGAAEQSELHAFPPYAARFAALPDMGRNIGTGPQRVERTGQLAASIRLTAGAPLRYHCRTDS